MRLDTRSGRGKEIRRRRTKLPQPGISLTPVPGANISTIDLLVLLPRLLLLSNVDFCARTRPVAFSMRGTASAETPYVSSECLNSISFDIPNSLRFKFPCDLCFEVRCQVCVLVMYRPCGANGDSKHNYVLTLATLSTAAERLSAYLHEGSTLNDTRCRQPHSPECTMIGDAGETGSSVHS